VGLGLKWICFKTAEISFRAKGKRENHATTQRFDIKEADFSKGHQKISHKDEVVKLEPSIDLKKQRNNKEAI